MEEFSKISHDENHEKYEDFYRKLRKKIENWAGKNPANPIVEYVLLLPDSVYLLIQLLRDSRVANGDKVKIVLALTYIVSPIDVIPDVFTGPGQLDDAYVAFLLIEILFLKYPDLCETHWPGDPEVLHNVQAILEKLKDIIGPDKLKAILEKMARKFRS